ncbi:hypothetical protein [Massilia sp. BSC265]|uniref:hypothetical protein n=1 Tax=Massilia sp. BSC265 TaxID=1549812 RepID=UPI0004E8A750|nr:hypothetical protein [Massilia sp. BSC265]KFI08308.1 hypothetical protein JN27_05780 [Massilia sp. BSC265]
MNDRFDVRHRNVQWLAWNRSFDPAQQLAVCASQLEMLRTTLGPNWPLLDKPRARQAGLAEVKFLAKHLIRVASESVDFYATVDFITNDAYERLDGMRRASGDRSLIGHLKNWDELTHEHMVPGTAVLHAVCGLKPDAPVLPVLDALSFRALVSGTKRKSTGNNATDAYLLDVEYGLKSKLPSVLPSRLLNQGLREWNQVPFRFWPLMRYEAAGLLPTLIPVTERARTLLDAYERARPD